MRNFKRGDNEKSSKRAETLECKERANSKRPSRAVEKGVGAIHCISAERKVHKEKYPNLSPWSKVLSKRKTTDQGKNIGNWCF